MSVEQAIELVFSRFSKRCMDTNSSIVDEEIKLLGLPSVLKGLLDLRHKRIKRLDVACIEMQCHSFTAHCFNFSNNRFASASLLRYVTIVLTPFFASAKAVCLPSPRLDPVTKAIFAMSFAIALSSTVTIEMTSSYELNWAFQMPKPIR